MRRLSLIGPSILLIIWWALVEFGGVSPLLIPSPKAVAEMFVRLLVVPGGLWPDVGVTLYRTIVSFLVAALIGIPLGLVMGFLPPVRRSLEFIVDFFRSIPPIALFPFFLLALGIGETTRLGVAVYGATLVIIINASYGVINAPAIRRTVGTAYGFSSWDTFLRIVIPDSLPQLFVGLRTALSLSLVLTIVVEMLIGGDLGLGKRIYDYHLVFKTPEMFVAILTTGFVGYGLNQGFLALERALVHWADK